jgi:ribosomal protein S18 acetylase RimI-like enzyme
MAELTTDKPISYITGDETLLDEIEALWTELKQLHLAKSPHFKQRYQNLTFGERKRALLANAGQGKWFVIIACQGGEKIGYCLASISDRAGEINSIFLQPRWRQKHIGQTLLARSLAWLHSGPAEAISVKVAVGNEEVFGFYAKYGFKPLWTELRAATDPAASSGGVNP